MVIVLREASATSVAAIIIILFGDSSVTLDFIQNLFLWHWFIRNSKNDFSLPLVRELFGAVIHHFIELLIDLLLYEGDHLGCSENFGLDFAKCQLGNSTQKVMNHSKSDHNSDCCKDDLEGLKL